MRIAISGSHSTGKSSLIAAFIARRPEYIHDRELRRALIDDRYSLFDDRDIPAVIELSPVPDRQLAELMRYTAKGAQ